MSARIRLAAAHTVPQRSASLYVSTVVERTRTKLCERPIPTQSLRTQLMLASFGWYVGIALSLLSMAHVFSGHCPSLDWFSAKACHVIAAHHIKGATFH